VWAFFLRGFLAVLKADPATARQTLARAVTGARKTGQLEALGHSLAMASIADNMLGERASARRLLNEAHLLAPNVDDVSVTVAVLQARTIDAFLDGDLAAVKAACTDGAHLSRESGDLYSLEQMLFNLGVMALAGDLSGARRLLVEALRIAHQIDDRLLQSYLLGALSCRAAAQSEPRLAARLLGAAEAQRLRTGANVIPIVAPILTSARDAAVRALGEAKFETEFQNGSSMSVDAAVRLTLGQPVRSTFETTGEEGAGPLSKREAQVARLVAGGLSNKAISLRLLISERTVDSHIRSMLNKLGFSSRAQIAAWVASTSGSALRDQDSNLEPTG
jgi:DNA-binding CsgD family transcriptional regulator